MTAAEALALPLGARMRHLGWARTGTVAGHTAHGWPIVVLLAQARTRDLGLQSRIYPHILDLGNGWHIVGHAYEITADTAEKWEIVK